MAPFYLTYAFVITVLTVAILLGALIYYHRKLVRSRRAFQELAQRFQGTIFRKSMFHGDLIEGQHSGITFTCRYFMGSKNTPPSLTIQVRVFCPAKLTIRRESWYDRFAIRIGLVAELRTGDPGFDKAYFFDTDREDIYQRYLSEEAKRREIDALFGLGHPVREIVFRKKDLRIVLSPIKEDEIASVPAEKYLDALLNLSAGLSSVGYPVSFASQRYPGSSRPPIPRVKLIRRPQSAAGSTPPRGFLLFPTVSTSTRVGYPPSRKKTAALQRNSPIRRRALSTVRWIWETIYGRKGTGSIPLAGSI
jgi:hypothetical protein